MRSELLQSISEIIGNYRLGEFSQPLDSNHVDKWVRQFSEESQEVILAETLHILKEWYFTNDHVDEIVDYFIEFLRKKYALKSTQEVIASTAFLSNQTAGKSQKIILSRLSERIQEQYGITLVREPNSKTQHYVYLDDGLYTGRRASADLIDCLSWIPKNGQLDAMYVLASDSTIKYIKYGDKEIDDALERNKVTLEIHGWKILQNDKFVKATPNGLEYDKIHSCLWPTDSLAYITEVAEFHDYLMNLGKKSEIFMYRRSPWLKDTGIFSSLENRNIVEKEFLIKGIYLHQLSSITSLYPLGFNRWPSFGFGSFCAFDMNISNTCPLVLWWGSIEATDGALGKWYPLFPRRVNGSEKFNKVEDYNDWDDAGAASQIYSKDQYNICPDCGSYFGLEQDGGNGFCINCAWKH